MLANNRDQILGAFDRLHAAVSDSIVQPGGWPTRKRNDGRTEWIPPPHLERGQPRVNLFHDPEKLLGNGDDDAS